MHILYTLVYLHHYQISYLLHKNKMSTAWEEFYATTPKPSNLDKNKQLLEQFINYHTKLDNKVALITSGGTTIPLEHNTVRFVDNFSAGTRGSISAENFLECGYAVIFIFRVKSLEPFSRHFVGSKFLDMLEVTSTKNTPLVSVTSQYVNKVSDILKKYKDSLEKHMLLSISFTTLSEYLWLLRSTCQALSVMENRAILYLAAAVSDFYIPSNEMATHKIPSNKPPSVHLKLVPKVLEPLVKLWVSKAFVISFKLETDKSILISKARDALRKYNHTLVIANMLQNRREQVIIVSKENQENVTLTPEQLQNGEEIEKYIVNYLVEKHKEWMKTKL